MEGRYNTRSPAVKRLMKEAQELSEPTDQYYAQPLEDNLFEWHFTVRGPADSEFQNGIYHGRIVLPVDYPMKPPSIIWLTPNGRFETNKKICLSISGHHPESWQPSWSIRTALLAIIGFMPTHGAGAIGSLDYTADERKVLAKKSREWKCPSCGDVQGILLEPSAESKAASEEVKKLAAQINFQETLVDDDDENRTKLTEENFEYLLDEWKRWSSSEELRGLTVDVYTAKHSWSLDFSTLADSSDLSRLSKSTSLPNVLVYKKKKQHKPIRTLSDTIIGYHNNDSTPAENLRLHRIEAVAGDSLAIGRRNQGHRRHHHHYRPPSQFSNDEVVLILLFMLCLGLLSIALAIFISQVFWIKNLNDRLYSYKKFYDEL